MRQKEVSMTGILGHFWKMIPSELARNGFCVLPNFLDADSLRSLRTELQDLEAQSALRPAGIGRGTRHLIDTAVRGDRIHWWDPLALTDAQRRVCDPLEVLRIACNRELFLGLESFEGHYALYPAGSFYRRHRDSFRDDDARVLSVVLYLNEAWSKGDGGELRLYAADTLDIEPIGGTLVAFLSREIEHEVLPTRIERRSLVGWFKRASV